MAHVYASVAEGDSFITDNGGTVLATQAAGVVARKLAVLEAASRRVDEYCERSPRFGSGFGPRIGTNRYDPVPGPCLYLEDDLLSLTSVSTYDTPGGSATTLTDETDFYKWPYDRAPYRELVIHEASSAVWGSATRGGAVIVGAWGYEDRRRTLTPTVSEAVDLTETSIDVSALTDLSAGLTLLIDSEQWFVRATTDAVTDSIDVDRGANGSTIATHNTASAIARYLYHPSVVDATLRIYLKRWAARGAGADGGDGAYDMGAVTSRESEDTILRRALADLVFRSAS